jgi:methionine-S-sulfoxide reductase
MSDSAQKEQAIFAAGCFWGVEAAFKRLDGVLATEVGYSGGHTDNPDYKAVCRGDTNHAEVVRLVFDPARITYRQLCDYFFDIHDPTTLNRQGPDVGTQYRSAVFYLSEAQRQAAEDAKAAAQKSVARPIVTEIAPAGPVTRAEDYHQNYLEKTGRVCRI